MCGIIILSTLIQLSSLWKTEKKSYLTAFNASSVIYAHLASIQSTESFMV